MDRALSFFPESEPLVDFAYQMRSRYSETDKMGYVFYGNYPDFFEVARTEMVRSSGFAYSELEEQGVMLPVVDMYVSYKKPVYYDELMDIHVFLYDMPNVRLDTYYKLYAGEENSLRVTGRVTLAFVDNLHRKPIRIPSAFLEALKSIQQTAHV